MIETFASYLLKFLIDVLYVVETSKSCEPHTHFVTFDKCYGEKTFYLIYKTLKGEDSA